MHSKLISCILGRSFFVPFEGWSLCLVEKAMAPHSSTLAWKIPWTEEPGRLQSMGSLRVGHDWVTSLSFFTFMHWRRKWQSTPVFLPGESQGRGSLVAAVYGVAQSWTRLKRLSSSSSSVPCKPLVCHCIHRIRHRAMALYFQQPWNWSVSLFPALWPAVHEPK